MRSIKALSYAPDVNDWLANSRDPRILHVFDQVCNLINERREVLSIVTPQIGNGPFNLVVNDNVLFSEYLNTESPISIRADQLHLGDLIIRTTSAKLWCPRPDWETLYAKRENILGQLATLPFSNHQSSIPNSLLSALSIALTNADLHSSLIATQKLAGLGNGLTPAGDDFILGAIYAAWIIHPPEIASVLAEAIANTAAPLTTSLSAAWLMSTVKGEAGILWHDFFDALISAQSITIKDSINKILAVGATSGADALAGFISVMMRWAEVGATRIFDKAFRLTKTGRPYTGFK